MGLDEGGVTKVADGLERVVLFRMADVVLSDQEGKLPMACDVEALVRVTSRS